MEALERAFDLSIRLNLPAISGSTLILVNSAPGTNLQTVGNNVGWVFGNSYSYLSSPSQAFSKSFLLAFMCMMACEDYDAYFLKEEDKVGYYTAKLCKTLMPGEGRILESVTKISVG